MKSSCLFLFLFSVSVTLGQVKRDDDCKDNLHLISKAVRAYQQAYKKPPRNLAYLVAADLAAFDWFVCPDSGKAAPKTLKDLMEKTDYMFSDPKLLAKDENSSKRVVIVTKPGNHGNLVKYIVAAGHGGACSKDAFVKKIKSGELKFKACKDTKLPTLPEKLKREHITGSWANKMNWALAKKGVKQVRAKIKTAKKGQFEMELSVSKDPNRRMLMKSVKIADQIAEFQVVGLLESAPASRKGNLIAMPGTWKKAELKKGSTVTITKKMPGKLTIKVKLNGKSAEYVVDRSYPN